MLQATETESAPGDTNRDGIILVVIPRIGRRIRPKPSAARQSVTAPRLLTYQWLSRQPLLLRYGSPIGDDEATVEALYQSLPHERVHHLVTYCWHYTGQQIAQHDSYVRSVRPEHVLPHLVNEVQVLHDLRELGIPATFVHQNAFLDERRVTIDTSVAKTFDAVYVARMNPFKRHGLASEVRRLLIVGGVQSRTDSPRYLHQLRQQLPHATLAYNRPRGRLPLEQVVALINSARVGLCLSQREGAMFAAGEYLLCGLPVVSTKSLGGRAEWLDGPHCRVTDDDPQAIREAVDELVSIKSDPTEIRQSAVARACLHRARFIDLVQRIFDEERAERDFAREWYPTLFHTFERWRPANDVMNHLADDTRTS